MKTISESTIRNWANNCRDHEKTLRRIRQELNVLENFDLAMEMADVEGGLLGMADVMELRLSTGQIEITPED